MSKERRVKLEKGKQRELIINLTKRYGSIKKLAKRWNLPYSTLKNYALEISLLPEELFIKIINELGIDKNALNFSCLDEYWGRSLGGERGMATIERKYPDKILEWRRSGIKKAIIMGKHLAYTGLKNIKKPKLNWKLAEFIGAYLGDGTLNQHIVRISGDYRYDNSYYQYLSRLVFELFGLQASIRKEKYANTLHFTIYSKNLCSFLNKEFNLKYGDKIRNRTIIPKRIFRDKKLSLACLRGLVDTDGSISRRGRYGSQFCIQFTSYSKPLLRQVYKIGREFGFFSFVDDKGTGTNKWDNIVKYFKIVGSSNLKHIVRFYLRYKENKTIYRDESPKYFEKDFYKKLDLPFKLKGPVV